MSFGVGIDEPVLIEVDVVGTLPRRDPGVVRQALHGVESGDRPESAWGLGFWVGSIILTAAQQQAQM